MITDNNLVISKLLVNYRYLIIIYLKYRSRFFLMWLMLKWRDTSLAGCTPSDSGESLGLTARV